MFLNCHCIREEKVLLVIVQIIYGLFCVHFILIRLSQGRPSAVSSASYVNQEKSRQTALAMLGFIVRKQPSWLYKITQHSLMKEVLKVLKHEEDLGVLMTALMDLLVLIPIVPVYISPYLQDLFEIFSRVASWR